MSYNPATTISDLTPWSVIYPFDNRAHPSKHKMWVCVSKDDLWFLRINSKSYDAGCVPLMKATHNFLTHDSFLRCTGDLITVTEIELEQILGQQNDPTKQGLIGHIDKTDRPIICKALKKSKMITESQIKIILTALSCD